MSARTATKKPVVAEEKGVGRRPQPPQHNSERPELLELGENHL